MKHPDKFTRCAVEHPDKDGLYFVQFSNFTNGIARYDTHSKSFSLRGVVAWCELSEDE